MIAKRTNDTLKFGYIIFVVLVSINFWSCRLISDGIYNMLEVVAILSSVGIVLYNSHILGRKLIFKYNVFFFMIIPIISCYSAYVYHNQALNLSLLMLRYSFLWFFYFVLHLFNVPVEKIIKFIIFVGVVWVLITIAQQFTYPTAWFFTKMTGDHYSIMRAGVARFMIYGQQYGAFLLIYSFYNYLISNKKNHFLLVAIGIIGFYYFGTRQFAISVFGCMLMAVLMVKGRAQLKAVVLFLIGLPLLIIFKDQLFASYIEITNDQWAYGADQRTLTANFYLYEYWPHWITKVIGNGPIHNSSDYGYETELLRYYFHYYRSDVGIIGAFNAFGIIHVINIILSNLIILRKKYFTYETRYLRLAFLYFIIILITSEFYSMLEGIPFYCLLYYLTDKSYEAKKASEEQMEVQNMLVAA